MIWEHQSISHSYTIVNCIECQYSNSMDLMFKLLLDWADGFDCQYYKRRKNATIFTTIHVVSLGQLCVHNWSNKIIKKCHRVRANLRLQSIVQGTTERASDGHHLERQIPNRKEYHVMISSAINICTLHRAFHLTCSGNDVSQTHTHTH